MALEIKKQERESPQSLLYRFNKSVQQSGILMRARKIRFREREKSRDMRKRAALRREELKKEYEKIKKLGKINE
jgi:ribosomal protein S21